MSQPTWKSQSGYIWSLIGSAVGFANILSFSAQAYKNGGGAFLIPYILALFLLGIPFLLLEGWIGYRWKLPLIAAYGQQKGRVGKFLGWMSILACLTIGAFYIVLTGYAAAYTYFSTTSQIPADTQTFFIHSFLKMTDHVSQFGVLSIPIAIATLVVGLATWFILVRQVRDGVEKICSIFMPVLAFILVAFAIIVSFLPGGWDGWSYYLKPNFEKLADPALWRDVFGQLFFSLSIGLGIIVGYSRHTGESFNITRAMVYVALGDFFVSFIAGFAIFGCLAHIAHVQQVPFESILTSDSTFEIGFILFPTILNSFGSFLSPILGFIFFFSVFIAGITGVFSIVESIAGNVEIEFKLTRQAAVTITVCALVSLGMIFCMGNGSHLIDALAPMVLGTSMLVSGLALWAVFASSSLSFGSDSFSQFLTFSLRYFAPLVLGVILFSTVWQESQSLDLLKIIRWGWLAGAFILAAGCIAVSEYKERNIYAAFGQQTTT